MASTLSTLGPVSFHPGSVKVGFDGQLQHDVSHRNTSSVSEQSIGIDEDAAYSGISFEVAPSGYHELTIGLASSGTDVCNFSVVLSSNGSGKSIQLKISELGHDEVHSIDCNGKQSVTIRLDGSASHVEYLLGGEVVHTSAGVAQLPLVCRSNVGRTFGGSIWLRAQDLRWSKALFKVMVLRVVDMKENGDMITSCVNMAGEELARVETAAGQGILELKEALAGQINVPASQLRLLNTRGEIVTDVELLLATE